MSVLAQEIIDNFDKLPDSEQLEIALAIMKRLVNFDFPQLTDEDFVLNAEELFLALDQQEADCEYS